MNILYLVALIGLMSITGTMASFYDTTCGQYKCTWSEMREVNYAKSLGVGNHSCIMVIVLFNADGSFNSTFEFPAIVDSFYNESTGSLDSVFIVGGTSLLIKEFCDGKGNTCITIDGTPYYIESKDQNVGVKASVWRAIGMYETTKNKKLRAMQIFHPTEWGDVLARVDLTENGSLSQAIFQKCVKQ